MPVTKQVVCSNCGNVWQEKPGARVSAKCPQCGGVNISSVAKGKILKKADPRKGRRWIR